MGFMRSANTNRKVKHVRIWLVANRQLVLDSLGCLLGSQRGVLLVGATDFRLSGPSASSKVDLVVAYLEPDDPPEVVEDLHTRLPNAKIIVISDGSDPDCLIKAFRYGAVGVVQAAQGTRTLLQAIQKACDGEAWLNQELLTNLLRKGVSAIPQSDAFGPANDSLTPRELEVITLIGRGLKSKLIAEELSISQATVRHHLSSIYGKLGVDDRLNLMIYAVEKGLVRL
jgi:two-component system response regulator NreC